MYGGLVGGSGSIVIKSSFVVVAGRITGKALPVFAGMVTVVGSV